MDKKKNAFLGAFIGDALALGPHWIYDTDELRDKYGSVEGIAAPSEDSFHKTKEKGEFTHYGDQMLMLAKYCLKNEGAFDKKDFLEHYYEWMKDYDGYKDHATKDTLKNIENGVYNGSESKELAGIISLPVMYYLSDDFKKDAIERTQATHNSTLVINIVMFTAELLKLIEKGKGIEESINKLKETAPDNIVKLIEAGQSKVEEPPVETIKSIGQSCAGENAFKSSIYLILKYKDDFKKALLSNVQAGGDSAARGIMIGTILGAYHGIDDLPKEWMEDMKYFDEVKAL